MKQIILVVTFILHSLMISCSEHPTSVSDSQELNTTSSFLKGSEYIPGTDITEQIRNDLNAGFDVKIPEGHYYVSEGIMVDGYCGTVKGEGAEETIIEAAQGFKPIPWPNDPNFEITPIFLLRGCTGDVTFKNMTILVNGDSPAVLHNNPWWGERITIDNVIVVNGAVVESGIVANFKNLKIFGDYSNDPQSIWNKNIAHPLIVVGGAGNYTVSTNINNCEIEYGAIGIEYYKTFGGSGKFVNNRISNCGMGVWLGFNNILSEATVMNNSFHNITRNAIVIQTENLWSVCLKNNTLDGLPLPNNCP
jgi:hypothetical protein